MDKGGKRREGGMRDGKMGNCVKWGEWGYWKDMGDKGRWLDTIIVDRKM